MPPEIERFGPYVDLTAHDMSRHLTAAPLSMWH